MSTRTNVITMDDLDGTEGATPVAFALDGTSLVIDLKAEHEAALRDALAPFIERARRITPGRLNGKATRGRHRQTERQAPRRTEEQPASEPVADQETPDDAPPPSDTPPDLASLSNADIRAWCKANGVPVNERGRIPGATKVRYLAAMNGH